MLDIKFIRANLDIVKAGATKKKVNIDWDKFISLDDDRLALLQETENLRAKQNEASKDIASTKDDTERQAKIADMQSVKEELKIKEEKLKTIEAEWNTIMLNIPNVPDITVPNGDSDEDNQLYSEWGEKPVFDFEPKDHIDILTGLKMIDLERGAKAHGFRGYFLKGWGARLSFAIWNYAIDFFQKKNFELVIPPVIVKNEYFYGTGHLPNETNDLYITQDGDNLAGTAEVPLMAFHADEVLSEDQLPVKFLGFSPCFRREAGSYSKDTKGLIRVHEFYKIEQVILCEASHQTSVEWHEQLHRNTEEFIESLGIHYRTVINCGADIGLGQVKKYDIELWVPTQEKYREIGSTSYFHDFQTRRFNIRYKDANGKLSFAHSLNATAIPTPRILVAMAENFQTKDGGLLIPEALRPYLGGITEIKPDL